MRKHKCIVLGPKAGMRKGEAEQKLRDVIKNKVGVTQKPAPDPGTTFRWFVESVYIPVCAGQWSDATAYHTTYNIRHYLISVYGDRALEDIDGTELQIFLNESAKQYAEGTVRAIYMRLRAIMKMARKKHYLQEDPAEDLKMPRTSAHPKPIVTKEQLAALLNAITNPMHKCLMMIGCFCALRTSEVFGLIWAACDGDSLSVKSTSWRLNFYANNAKNESSKSATPIPDVVRPYIEEWRTLCENTSPDALLFSRVVSKGRMKDQVAPFDPYQFMTRHIHPLAKQLGIPTELATFRVFRRTAATELQLYGTIKDVQSAARHENPTTTLKYYVQPIAESTRKAVNDRASDVLASDPNHKKRKDN